MTNTRSRRVLSNDDGWILAQSAVPLTPDRMWDVMISPYVGSPIDGFVWSVGGHDVFGYETEIGERFGQSYERLDDPKHRQKARNLQYLIDEHGGPVTVIAQLCRRAGIAFFPSVRMNEHYDMEVASPAYGRLRREHPELLIGRPGEDFSQGSIEWGIRTGLNYAIPEVRSRMTGIILELLERFDVDGIELDFMRHPAYFRVEEAYANRFLITDMVRGIRNRMDALAAERGRSLDLIARVPPTLRDSVRIGLDVGVWIEEGLVDIVVAGGGFIPFEMPIEEFVEAARGADCRIYGCLEGLRPAVDEPTLRAIAARYWDAGVDGLYLFNHYSMPEKWKRGVLAQLADREALARLDKRYEMDKNDRFGTSSQLGLSFRNAIPLAQVPVELDTTSGDRGVVLRLDIADDLEGSRAQGALGPCTLGLLLDRLAADDMLQVTLNGVALDWSEWRRAPNGWSRKVFEVDYMLYPSRTREETLSGAAIEFELGSPPLKHGVNELEVRFIRPGVRQSETRWLRDVRVSIRYKSP